MVIVHISDESVTTLKGVTVPTLGQHIGDEYLAVLKEVCEWRYINYPNQVMLPVAIADVNELERLISSLKVNSPMPSEGYDVLVVLYEELGAIQKVEVPMPDTPAEAEDEVFGPPDPNAVEVPHPSIGGATFAPSEDEEETYGLPDIGPYVEESSYDDEVEVEDE